jgi:glycosyltransferase involved in cell wall biosynthesis
MKPLFISNYGDQSGWAEAARNYILCMDSVRIEVLPRRIRFDQVQTVPKRILELENKDVKFDTVIQNVLPHTMEYVGGYKNIGLFYHEVDSLIGTNWEEHLNLMDEVWVINNSMVDACLESGIKKPIRVIPHTFNLDKFFQNYKTLPVIDKIKQKGNFIFYTVGEFVRRKNFGALLRAFHTEFSVNEKVDLVIKTSRGNEFRNFAKGIKEGLKLNRYKEEIVIDEYLEDSDLYSIHQDADCFVQTSFGEAWSIPAFDAMGFGKTPLVPRCTGYLDYIPCEELLIPTQKEIVFGNNESDSDLYTGREMWYHIDLPELRKKMRFIFEEKQKASQEYLSIVSKCQEKVHDFSYNKIGEKIKRCLSEP